MAFIYGGESYKKRALLSRALIGFVGDDSLRFDQEKTAPPPLSASASAGMANLNIIGTVFETADKPVAGVLVRLSMILPSDSLYNTEITEIDSVITDKTAFRKKIYIHDSTGHRQLQSMTLYARTDAAGKFSFTGLPGKNHSRYCH